MIIIYKIRKKNKKEKNKRKYWKTRFKICMEQIKTTTSQYHCDNNTRIYFSIL